MIVKAIREGLGRIIVFVDFITRPKQIVRSESDQNKADEQAKNLALYQFYACPFCTKVRRNIHRLNISVELRDAQNNATFREELLKEGGAIKVPCLRIEENGRTKWMYESSDINEYLNAQFENMGSK